MRENPPSAKLPSQTSEPIPSAAERRTVPFATQHFVAGKWRIAQARRCLPEGMRFVKRPAKRTLEGLDTTEQDDAGPIRLQFGALRRPHGFGFAIKIFRRDMQMPVKIAHHGE